MTTSVLDDLGEEITGILAPVTLCMALTVALVKTLNPTGDSDRQSLIVATAYYDEQEDDSASTKFSGSVMNAVIFVAIITLFTFVLFLLFKYNCINCIYFYMGFAMLDVFFFLTGAVIIKLLRKADAHMDAISLCFILFNFAVVGTLGLFFWKIPILAKQVYLIVVGVTVAYIFTWIPEWSTWALLIFMSIYDLCAVLLPGGPLKALVELAMERNEPIPALVYEVRPTQGRSGDWNNRYERRNRRNALSSQYQSACLTATLADVSNPTENAPTREETQDQITEESALVGPSRSAGGPSSTRRHRHRQRRDENQEHSSFEVDSGARDSGQGTEMDLVLPDSLKLGLGDFIFYSVLVGRAAFYDFMTVFAAYFGIIAGMCLTLLLLALYQKALPALPISIVLGLMFYFLTKLVLEPFILPLALSLTFF